MIATTFGDQGRHGKPLIRCFIGRSKAALLPIGMRHSVIRSSTVIYKGATSGDQKQHGISLLLYLILQRHGHVDLLGASLDCRGWQRLG